MIVQILQAARDYIKKTNGKPTTAYLGHREYAQAKACAECKYTVTGHHEDGFFVGDIRLVNVNENSHFKIVGEL
jgi:hypothetical protein